MKNRKERKKLKKAGKLEMNLRLKLFLFHENKHLFSATKRKKHPKKPTTTT